MSGQSRQAHGRTPLSGALCTTDTSVIRPAGVRTTDTALPTTCEPIQWEMDRFTDVRLDVPSSNVISQFGLPSIELLRRSTLETMPSLTMTLLMSTPFVLPLAWHPHP